MINEKLYIKIMFAHALKVLIKNVTSNYISAIFVGFQLFSNQLRIGISAILAKISINTKNGISAIFIF